MSISRLIDQGFFEFRRSTETEQMGEKKQEGPGGVRVVFLGTGDAFGSGGRNQSSYLIQSGAAAFLLDCGPTALLSLKRLRLDLSSIHSIFVSHFHGDHFGGIPFFFLEWLYHGRSGSRIRIVGPPGIQKRVEDLHSAMYGAHRLAEIRLGVQYQELKPDRPTVVGDVKVTPFHVPHMVTSLSLGLKIQIGGKTVLYSGDSPWTPAFERHCRETDLFICECTHYRVEGGSHMSLEELVANREALKESRRVVLSHIGQEVLDHGSEIPFDCAKDGMTLDL